MGGLSPPIVYTLEVKGAIKMKLHVEKAIIWKVPQLNMKFSH